MHFMHFHKWGQVFSEIESDQYDGNTIDWHLSEIIAGLISAEPSIYRVLRPYNFEKSNFYNAYGVEQIGGESIGKYFSNLYFYQKEIKGASMDEILTKMRQKAKKYWPILEKCYPILKKKMIMPLRENINLHNASTLC